MAHIRTSERCDALALLPGQAVHLGHSCVLLNVAGLRLLLDPATLTGHATAPFANLTTTDCPLQTYRPLFDLPALIGSSRSLARAADVVLYSHMHADHFNAAVLLELMAQHPDLRVVLPHGGLRLLNSPRGSHARLLDQGRQALARLNWLDTSPVGLGVFLNSTPPDLPIASMCEVDDGAVIVLRESPRVELRAFATTHPRPLMWVPTPFEAAFPPVLGYEIGYDDHGVWRHVLLVGETALDADVLHRIAARAATLTTVFLPVDLPLGGRWLAPWYEHVCHAPPRFLAMAARLAGPRSTIMPIHQGLWCYDYAPDDVPNLTTGSAGQMQPLEAAVVEALTAARAHASFGPARLRAWRRLTEALSTLPQRASISNPDPGQIFALDRERPPARSAAMPVAAWSADGRWSMLAGSA